jgi:hypothetical protein
MSALSFVAVSMQTTHLDPATVSQAAYLKVVDGNITRLDAIDIIPPTTTATPTAEASNAVSWEEALSQLSMVIGKLPIVSYYRDADKEIFRAASRRSDITPPDFQWLDCRALARELLPDLSDHQLSTVLKTLGLFDEHADSSTVEQTARIVQQLAQQREATTVHQLWGDLYDQPDDPLGLEATLAALSSTAAAPISLSPQTEPDIANPKADQTAAESAQGAEPPDSDESANDTDPAHTAAIAITDMTDSADEPETAEISVSEATPSQEEKAQPLDADAEIQLRDAEDAVSFEDSEPSVVPPATEAAEPLSEDTSADNEADEAAPSDPDESVSEDLDDSTAESVINRANLEQPEFLKEPDTDLDETETFETETVAVEEDLDDTAPIEKAQLVSEAGEPETTFLEQTHADDAEETVSDPEQTQATAAEAEEPTQGADSSTNVDEQPDDEADIALADVDAQPAYAEPEPVLSGSSVASRHGTDQPSDDPSVEPTGTQPIAVLQKQPERESSASTAGRFWAVLGIIFFGLLTLLGLGLTVMATLLFFTTNELLLETKIAGVVLTGAITLLCLLMTTLSLHSYRRK